MLLASQLLASLLAAAPAPPALDQSFLDEWGTIIDCAGGLYFQSADDNQVYELGSTGPFQAGDTVYVIGTGGSSGMSACPLVNEVFPFVTVSSFDPILETCPCDPAVSCTGTGGSKGCPNNGSAFSGAELIHLGMPSATASFYQLDLFVQSLPPSTTTVVFMGHAAAPPTPLGDGLLCIGSGTGLSLYRFPVRSATNAGHVRETDVVLTSQSFAPGGRITVGSTWHFQAWYRNPFGPCGTGSNTSNGLQITFLL